MSGNGITRRSLLKTGLATGALMAASPVLDFNRWAAATAGAPAQSIPSLCNGCSSHCGILAQVKNGRLWKVTGHPDHNRSRGMLCARAHGTAGWLYDPDRLSHSLKREGDTFKPIPYEQALDEIAARLRSILEEHGPGSLFYGHNPRALGVFYATRFMHALGAPTIVTHNAACNTTLNRGFESILGAVPGADMGRSKYIILIGRNPAEGIRPSHTLALAKALEAGVKVVVIDPRLSASGALASEWVPIRPGTDLALVLAMCRVLVRENLHDASFVAENSVGFETFAASLEPWTPAWAASITDVPAVTIARLARELAAARPNCLVHPSWKGAFGTNYLNSAETARAVGALNALLGNLGQPGGLSFHGGPPLGKLDPERHPGPPKPTVPRSDGAGVKGEFPLAPVPQGLPHVLMQKAREGKVKAGIIRHFNPVRNFPDPEHMRAGMAALDLLVVIDTHLTETAMLAHYVLPEPSYLEREEIVEGAPGRKPTVAMRTKAVERLHPGTHTFEETITGLARRLDIGHYFDFTLDELNGALLAPLGVSLEEMKARGSITLDRPGAPPGMPKLKTASGKVEFASSKYAELGFDEVPRWQPPKVLPDKANPKSFRLIHGKQGYHSHTATNNLPYLLQITKDYDSERLWMSRTRAGALGISDGDLVAVTAGRVRRQVRVKTTERLHPDAVYLPGGYGNWSPYLTLARDFGINSNDFAPYQVDPLSGHSMMMEVIVEVEKA